MLKRMALAAVFGALTIGTALAQAPDPAAAPTNPDQCLEAASNLLQKAEQKGLPEAELDRIEEMLVEMEDRCEAGNMEEATALAKEIQADIEAK